MTDSEKSGRYRCTECGHTTTPDEMDSKPVFEDCHECGANGNHKGYYPVWECPNCNREYVGSRPSASSGGVRGCNRCFTSIPINRLREAIEEGDASRLERYLPTDSDNE